MTHDLPRSSNAPDGDATGLPWIRVAEGAPYFVTEAGEAWTPIGQNDGIGWVDLEGLFRRRDVAAVEGYLMEIKGSGVTCLRLMLEHSQVRHRYLEKPVGRFVPAMVALWDTLFALCGRIGLRILLTPFDTFWAWNHWRHHPYNIAQGGVVDHPSRWLSDRAFRAALENRLTFAVRRWGGSGVLFAWDLWNEIHPAHDGDSTEKFGSFIADIGGHVRRLELALYGRCHLQTVSAFWPELTSARRPSFADAIFRHAALDFATVHIYEEGTIDHPRDTVAPALAAGRIVRECLAEIGDGRPFLDSEHGPIHGFNDRKITLPQAFDDEYFRNMQWAHLASGGAGGGMRWPYRHPHRLTPGMRAAQRALAGFCALIDWPRFRRRPLDVFVEENAVSAMACGDARQAVVWCLRLDTLQCDGRMRQDSCAASPSLTLNGFENGAFTALFWDTSTGEIVAHRHLRTDDCGSLTFQTHPFRADIAVALTAERSRVAEGDPTAKAGDRPSPARACIAAPPASRPR